MKNKKHKIPVYRPMLMGNEKKYVNECLDSSWISSRGGFISRFEESFSNYTNIKASTAVSNGTVALHLALHTLGIGPGDEVIVPTLTYIASVNPISYVGAKPVFVDSLEDTWNIDPKAVVAKITKKTKAIMIVHLYGNPCDMDQIESICRDHDLYMIEDAAEAIGSQYRNKHAGSFGTVAAFSFFGNKTITTGEGGMVASNNKALIERAAYIKSQSVSTVKEYWHEEIGFNYRMTNICAAIGLAQLENIGLVLKKKQQIAEWYRQGLATTSIKFQEIKLDCISSHWMVSVLALNANKLEKIRTYLKCHDVETRPLFPAVHRMPMYKQDQSFPVAESLCERGLNLPSFPELSKEDIEYICKLIKQSLDN
tara:strand:- start:1684 stop:2787 length:1104 start_codon:yes stop_codon:yes gene_type:complete